nr:hypothetical protein [Phycisphaerae bacterium]NIX32569.1 hypothetical protein [Phycisphaerae bacterium]
MYGIISPADWGLKSADGQSLQPWGQLGIDASDWEERARQATYHWLMRNWNEGAGAFNGHYRVAEHAFQEPQLTNLLAPWQLMAAYDRYEDADLLHKAQRSADWLYAHLVETHPMSMVVGGVRDAWRPEEVWTKFTAEFVILNLGLYTRLQEEEYMRRALESVRFLVQAELHDHATKYDHQRQRWIPRGWQSFGRIIEAFLYLYEITQDNRWLGRALSWGEWSLTLQAPDSAFYLINREYYNSDIAADELRALTFLYEQTRLPQFLRAAERFADWHLQNQRPSGAWLLTIDRFSRPVSEYVGPGDVPNIAMALLRLHRATGEPRYVASALKAMKYVLTRQVTPGSSQPYVEDENALWG